MRLWQTYQKLKGSIGGAEIRQTYNWRNILWIFEKSDYFHEFYSKSMIPISILNIKWNNDEIFENNKLILKYQTIYANEIQEVAAD